MQTTIPTSLKTSKITQLYEYIHISTYLISDSTITTTFFFVRTKVMGSFLTHTVEVSSRRENCCQNVNKSEPSSTVKSRNECKKIEKDFLQITQPKRNTKKKIYALNMKTDKTRRLTNTRRCCPGNGCCSSFGNWCAIQLVVVVVG